MSTSYKNMFVQHSINIIKQIDNINNDINFKLCKLHFAEAFQNNFCNLFSNFQRANSSSNKIPSQNNTSDSFKYACNINPKIRNEQTSVILKRENLSYISNSTAFINLWIVFLSQTGRLYVFWPTSLLRKWLVACLKLSLPLRAIFSKFFHIRILVFSKLDSRSFFHENKNLEFVE